uniref:Gag-pol polyprotein n=1 Tax=Solanum tuberosum TaxID=4113 RepID=M1DSY0_SOLTU
MREYPKNKHGNVNGGNRAQSSSVALPDRATPRGATSGTGGGSNCLYAITSRQEQQDLPDVVSVNPSVLLHILFAQLEIYAKVLERRTQERREEKIKIHLLRKELIADFIKDLILQDVDMDVKRDEDDLAKEMNEEEFRSGEHGITQTLTEL